MNDQKNPDIILRHGVSALSIDEKVAWIQLFCHCFKKNENQAESIFRKYVLHGDGSIFCFGLVDRKIVACYSGLILAIGDKNIFLSTDTMSKGIMVNATVRLGNYLYGYLSRGGVVAVCGYPNENIALIRQRRLGWRMAGSIYPFVGVPLLWRIFMKKKGDAFLWSVIRPPNGFFSKPPPFVSLLGRSCVYGGSLLSLCFTLAAKPPGMFFIRIPSALIKPKKFGYVLLCSNTSFLEARITEAIAELDIDTIDVP
ncbi:hypothetical protein ICN17_01240 [Polynucleobacter sp. 73C-SIWE]|uniref:hypothetical protein n=1 Tax=Polynucleobacter sp. 73C-SIWE TaxID=2689098 RepID=UPI001C0BAD7B|nr:hypothetical protein [Polynucleobacter sp. 73C-SIWE]MBU3578626.1 hypothetical protein [Polynucleobacter sp. 73C-SIWE]